MKAPRTATLAALVAAAATALFTTGGCTPTESAPTPAAVTAVAQTVGSSAALIANSLDLDAPTRAAVSKALATAKSVFPTEGQSFTDAWTPVAQSSIDALVADGKITEDAAALAMIAFDATAKGMDYLITVKYPAIRQNADLVTAAVFGFVDGFNAYFNYQDEVRAYQSARRAARARRAQPACGCSKDCKCTPANCKCTKESKCSPSCTCPDAKDNCPCLPNCPATMQRACNCGCTATPTTAKAAVRPARPQTPPLPDPAAHAWIRAAMRKN